MRCAPASTKTGRTTPKPDPALDDRAQAVGVGLLVVLHPFLGFKLEADLNQARIVLTVVTLPASNLPPSNAYVAQARHDQAG
jgi:hypothetical protein